MGTLSDIFNFERVNFGNIWNQIQDNPERLLLGSVDPFSTELWNKITGSNHEPMVNMLGGPMGSGWAGLGENGGVYDLARDQGVNTKWSEKSHDVAEVIASIYGGSALGGLFGGGGAAGASGGAASGASGSAGGLLGSGTGAGVGAGLEGVTVVGSSGGGLGAAAGGGAGGLLGMGDITQGWQAQNEANLQNTASGIGAPSVGGFDWMSMLQQGQGLLGGQGGGQGGGQQPVMMMPQPQQNNGDALRMQLARNSRAQALRRKIRRSPDEDRELRDLSTTGLLG